MTTRITTKDSRKLLYWLLAGGVGLVCLFLYAYWLHISSLNEKLERKFSQLRADKICMNFEQLEEEYYPQIPSANNAAHVLQQAFAAYIDRNSASYEQLPLIGTGELPAIGKPLDDKMLNLITLYVKEQQQALKYLRQGAAMSQCRYPIDLSAGFNALLPHLTHIQTGSKLLSLQAILHCENDCLQGAVNTVCTGFGLAYSLHKEPLLISQLVRIAAERIMLDTCNRLLNRKQLNAKQLRQLATVLQRADMPQNFENALYGELCMSMTIFDKLLHGSAKDLRDLGLSDKLPASLYSLTGLFQEDCWFYLDTMQRTIKAFRLDCSQRYEAINDIWKDFSKNMRSTYVLCNLLLPALKPIAEKHGEHLSLLRVALTVVNIEQYRLKRQQLPEKLSQITEYLPKLPRDPFGGKMLIYRQKKHGYVVYGVGPNGKDDGGVLKDDSRSQNWDVAFVIERVH